MALLKDQPISCLTDWIAYDTKLTILSEQESTSVEAKSRLAQNEIETQITAFLLRQSGVSENASRKLIDKVTVTEPLLRWHSLLTLSMFYADLASLQNSALHREQSRYFEAKSDAARDHLFDTGVGIVNQPIPKAPAPQIISSPGTNPQRFLRGRICFVDADGARGAASSEFLLDMTDGETIELVVPALPVRCTGWLLFLGETSDSMVQAGNGAMPAVAPYEISASEPAPDAPPMSKDGQSPDRFIRYTTELWR